ncbi:Fe-S-containing hydro-lyase [Campylobacter cuniculorum]|uniref:Tartrate dehydratase/fumarate hydratase, beta subunit n=2 Tax=Campylobacter cuniculorum TaxID=374106 RepID=A0A1W6BUG4_9BACT|nr:Fe-S-containing hydro-lyase [Campylobacter cuniculorum]ARJ55726.1 tartrate dehydratase/fumarate hydratase, beta subunit [Campylobacter cuniculorum DSM 23162 = LMG 24588]QOR04947.1 Fe-S-containing hydro-lyase [Campylobacter cuniculorum]
MATIKITTPLTKEKVKELKAGDNVLITGTIIAARDAAHKALTEALARGEKLPVDFNNEVIYYLGPSPANPDKNQAVGSAGPTTSGRMDKYTPTMLEQGVSGMIGKGYRSEEVIKSMIKNGAVYMVAIGGAGALISKSIKKYEVLAYPELGPEAVARLSVEDFPAIVAIDCKGNNFYEQGQAPYKKI